MKAVAQGLSLTPSRTEYSGRGGQQSGSNQVAVVVDGDKSKVLSNPEPSNDVGSRRSRGRSGLSTCARGAAKQAAQGAGRCVVWWAVMMSGRGVITTTKHKSIDERQTDVSKCTGRVVRYSALPFPVTGLPKLERKHTCSQPFLPQGTSLSLPLPACLSPHNSTPGRSRFPRLALSARRKGGEIGGLDQKDQRQTKTTRWLARDDVRTWLAARSKK